LDGTLTISGNTVSGTTAVGTNQGILAQDADVSVTVSGNTVSNFDWGIHVEDTDATVSGSVISSIGEFGIYCYADGDVTVSRNYVTGGEHAVCARQGATYTVDIIYNLLLNSSVWSVYVDPQAGAAATTNLYNNVVYDTANAISVHIEDEASGSIKNNIIYSTDATVQLMDDDTTGVLTIDYNYYYAPNDSTAIFDMDGVSDDDLTDWQAGTTYDDNSAEGDPLFSNAGVNFHLQSTSSAIDAGVDVSLTTDYDGASVPAGSAPDMGAFEYRTQGIIGGVVTGGTVE